MQRYIDNKSKIESNYNTFLFCFKMPQSISLGKMAENK